MVRSRRSTLLRGWSPSWNTKMPRAFKRRGVYHRQGVHIFEWIFIYTCIYIFNYIYSGILLAKYIHVSLHIYIYIYTYIYIYCIYTLNNYILIIYTVYRLWFPKMRDTSQVTRGVFLSHQELLSHDVDDDCKIPHNDLGNLHIRSPSQRRWIPRTDGSFTLRSS